MNAHSGRPMIALGTHSSDELIRFIEAAGENANIDAKGPMTWDSGEASAGLTKDILALANSRDGGVIVVGKKEPQPGKFVMAGLNETQASSFETTKVATWVNNHCSPPVNLVCYRQEHQGQKFVVITVSEFHDVPVICTKQFEIAVPGKTSKVMLRNGVVYVRTANAESAPLSTVEEVRQLIGMATTKRADQMLAMFQAMMKGRPLLAEKPDEERWTEQAEIVQSDLDSQLGEQAKLGQWVMQFHPISFRQERWQEAAEMKALVEKHAVRLREEFPGIHHDYHVREWGVCSHEYDDVFGLTRSGLFVANRVFREDTEVFKSPWQPTPDIPAGQWIDLQWNIAQVIEFFMFMSRFGHEFDVGEDVAYEISCFPLNGRHLVSLNHGHFLMARVKRICRVTEFRRGNTVSVEVLRSSWEDECARMLFWFFELFGSHPIELGTLRTFVERFKNRTFWN